jgi:geranylgeranyl diphosphate synthase type II
MNKLFFETFAPDVERINAALDQFLPEEEGEFGAVSRAARYSLLAGGKRIRPLLTLAFARALGGDATQAIPFACAVEMVHTYSLIHDDLPCMDDDDIRRGRPSCHKAFGEATALLAGDALLTLAFEQIGKAPQTHGTDPAACARACAILAECAGVSGMVHGQTMDLANEGKTVSAAVLRQTYLEKTSALLRAACLLGAVSAGCTEQQYAAAKQYANELGLAFQIVDDVLDVTADEAVLGKPVGSDAEQEKTTYVTLYGLEAAQREAASATERAVAALREIPQRDTLLLLTEELLGRDR